jgi:hypothetical protein
MITVPAGVRVLVATKPVDFRKGPDGLVALVRETLREDPFSGAVVIFRSKRADRLKMVTWDGSGLVLVWNDRRRQEGCRGGEKATRGNAGQAPDRYSEEAAAQSRIVASAFAAGPRDD